MSFSRDPVVIVRFFQRYASFFAILGGFICSKLIVPKEAEWWMKAAVGLPITIALLLLLYKYGVTRNTRR